MLGWMSSQGVSANTLTLTLAPFTPQAVTQLERSADAWRTTLASEALLAVRALQQRGLIDELMHQLGRTR